MGEVGWVFSLVFVVGDIVVGELEIDGVKDDQQEYFVEKIYCIQGDFLEDEFFVVVLEVDYDVEVYDQKGQWQQQVVDDKFGERLGK